VSANGPGFTRQRLLSVTAGVASVALVLDASAAADEACARVVAPTTLSASWAEAVVDLRKEIAQLPASDCQRMTLSLDPQDEGMRIVATTSDGRRAERIVGRAENLVARALGLLMTIPEALPPVLTASPAPERPAPSETLPVTAIAGPATATAPRATALWAGLSGGIRLAAPTALSVIDVEARADIIFDRWLMLVSLQSSLVSCLGQQGLDCDVYNDVSLGVGVGRRFRLGAPDIDVAFAPSVVVMHMEYDGTSGGEGQSLQGTEVVLRFDASARLAVPVNPHWALTFTLDGGLAPSMLTSPARLSLPAGVPAGAQPPPPFPAWSGGVRLGASGAVL